MPDEGFTELAGPRVALRRFGLGDVDEFVAYRSAERVARFQSWDAPYPREAGDRLVRQMMSRHPDTAGEWFQFAVVLRANGQLIGDCAAMPHADDPPVSIRAAVTPPKPCACWSATCSPRGASTGSRPPATPGTPPRPPCWNGWPCGGKVICARAPGPRASGPMTCCTRCCGPNGQPRELTCRRRHPACRRRLGGGRARPELPAHPGHPRSEYRHWAQAHHQPALRRAGAGRRPGRARRGPHRRPCQLGLSLGRIDIEVADVHPA